MRRSNRLLCGLAAMLAGLCVAIAQADVFNMGGARDPVAGTWTGLASLEFVTVGDPGNARDTWTGSPYGSVDHVYRIGKYDVTVGQYIEFLNAVAKTSDPYGLYNNGMATNYPTITITKSGSAGNYSYSYTGSYSQGINCPIYSATWGSAARFCNWVQNGQPAFPTGTPGEVAGSTETGVYTLNGATSQSALMAITRNAGATYFIPTEDEWYKAAYYKGGGSNTGYWFYPTQSNTVPSHVLSSTGTNNANFATGDIPTGCTDPANRLTTVGAFAASPGPYGTYDMGGDVFQWNETSISGSFGPCRGVRGGMWSDYHAYMASYTRGYYTPTFEYFYLGFRVASVPEPGSIALVLAGAIALLAYVWRARRA
jgi:formylglycine-generating enzyme